MKDRTANMMEERSGTALFLLHAACFLLVVCYVNMFRFWAWLSGELGPGLLVKILPVIVTVAVLLVIFTRFIQRVNRGYRIRFLYVGPGVVFAFLALAIPDPQIPIKRIHVAEYIMLAFLVRYVLSHRLNGMSLVLFTVLVTALYGVHDEMLQGLHPQRYYGWRDMIVNGVAGLSGALLGHGLVCFTDQGSVTGRGADRPVPWRQAVFFTGLLGALVWQIIYLYQHLTAGFTYLALIPVVACAVVVGAVYPATVFSSKRHHGLQAVFWLVLGTVVYPLLSGVSRLEFL